MNTKLLNDFYLSEHFRFCEFFTQSFPDSDEELIKVFRNLTLLCNFILEPVRKFVDKPLQVTSGYRSKVHNKQVGGVPTSSHLHGVAADIVCDDSSVLLDVYDHIVNSPYIALNVFECLLYWRGSKPAWLHVSFDLYNREPRFNRTFKIY